ncbi:MAG: hypothetical protein HYZ29_08000 [Myxococcales bacterium]|nr:hypothetical protein [Myxococcales bacterium]
MADEQDRESPEDEADAADDEQDEAPAAARRRDDDDDDDDDDDEAPPPPKKKEARSAEPKRRRRPEALKPVLPPEREIAAPSRQTLVMLGVMAGATLLMWGSARFACNAHPAQTRKPREVTTAELSRDPKGAALELQQRWNGYDFKGALELAKGGIADELQKAQGDCDKDSAGCESKKKSVEGQVLATAALLSRGPGSAKVRVVSRGGAGGNQTVVYTLEQEGAAWKVSGRGAEDPTPAKTAEPTAAPAPSGSAPPPTSAAPKPSAAP